MSKVSALNADPSPDNGGVDREGSHVKTGKAKASEQLTTNKDMHPAQAFATDFDMRDANFMAVSLGRTCERGAALNSTVLNAPLLRFQNASYWWLAVADPSQPRVTSHGITLLTRTTRKRLRRPHCAVAKRTSSEVTAHVANDVPLLHRADAIPRRI